MPNTPFIEFLARSGAIQFGEFTLKSGRVSPFFITTAALSHGASTYELARYYAAKIKEAYNDQFDALFGPSYKGIPLAVSVSIALQKEFGMDKPWLFDRKERKTYGDASAFVGADMDTGARIIVLDDVFTTGETKLETTHKIEKILKSEVAGVVVAVNRQERGIRLSAVEEFSENTGIPVHSLVTIQEVFEHLHNRPIDGKTYVDEKLYGQFLHYRKKYGV